MYNNYNTCPERNEAGGQKQTAATPAPKTEYTAPPAAKTANEQAPQTLIFGQAVPNSQPKTPDGQPHKHDIRAIAAHVAALMGAETFPLVGKAPAAGHCWNTSKVLGRPGVQEAPSSVWAMATGYGVMSPARGDLFILESDDPAFTAHLFSAHPILQNAPLVFSGDPNRAGRCHIYLRLDRQIADILLATRIKIGASQRGALSLRNASGEIASLRGHGAYVVGPGSLHPASGLPYTSNDQAVPLRLDATQTAQLLAYFLVVPGAGHPYPPMAEPAPQPLLPPEPIPEPVSVSEPVSEPKPAKPKPESVPAVAMGNTPRTPRVVFTAKAATPALNSTLRDAVRKHLLKLGYQPNGEWLNGRCPHPEHHKHDDAHPSFGFNVRLGVGKCFVCGNFGLAHVAHAFGLTSVGDAGRDLGNTVPQDSDPTSGLNPGGYMQPSGNPVPDRQSDRLPSRPCVFIGEFNDPALVAAYTLPAHGPFAADRPDRDALAPDALDYNTLDCELNIATALIERGAGQAARLYDLLTDHARHHDGQHTYTTAAIRQIGGTVGLSEAQVAKALRQMRDLGLITALERGRYQRLGVAAIKARLGLGEGHALARLPRAIYRDHTRYVGALVVSVQRFLPPGLPSEAIAGAVGLSRRALYDHEAALRILRTPRRELVNPATAAVRFYKVYDEIGHFVMAFDADEYESAREVAAQKRGHYEAWRQHPSLRQLVGRRPEARPARWKNKKKNLHAINIRGE